MKTMILRVSTLLELPVCNPPPVRVLEYEDMPLSYRRYWAYYNPRTKEIFLRTEYQHLIVHELCHHVQNMAGLNSRMKECEDEARRVQRIYFTLFPNDWKEEWMP